MCSFQLRMSISVCGERHSRMLAWTGKQKCTEASDSRFEVSAVDFERCVPTIIRYDDPRPAFAALAL